MKTAKALILICAFFTFKASAQEFNKSINKDSLLNAIVKDMPESKKNEFLESYNSGNEKSKEFLLFMFSMPRSSKNELIKNIDSNYDKIHILKTEYAKLIAKNFTVRIEFNPANNIIGTKENIDLMIEENTSDGEKKVTQEWNIVYNSPELKRMLAIIKWDNEKLRTLKNLLTEAKCVSIENGEVTTVGFARSGLGKYSYLIFDKDLTSQQIKNHNNGCDDIFYKKNIVLNYAGGAVGSQCFPD